MAITAIIEKVLTINTAAELTAAAACDATAGAEVEYSKKDDGKILLIFTNADTENAENVTIKKGTGIQAVADYVFSLPASKVYVLVVESGKYVDDDGKLTITGTADVTVQAVILP